MCELGFQHLSVTTLEGGDGWFWEGLQKMWLNNTFLSVHTLVSIGGAVCSSGLGGGKMGCYWCTLSFSNIGVLQLILLCCIVRHLGENNC
jgi:hypothetical protein